MCSDPIIHSGCCSKHRHALAILRDPCVRSSWNPIDTILIRRKRKQQHPMQQLPTVPRSKTFPVVAVVVAVPRTTTTRPWAQAVTPRMRRPRPPFRRVSWKMPLPPPWVPKPPRMVLLYRLPFHVTATTSPWAFVPRRRRRRRHLPNHGTKIPPGIIPHEPTLKHNCLPLPLVLGPCEQETTQHPATDVPFFLETMGPPYRRRLFSDLETSRTRLGRGLDVHEPNGLSDTGIHFARVSASYLLNAEPFANSTLGQEYLQQETAPRTYSDPTNQDERLQQRYRHLSLLQKELSGRTLVRFVGHLDYGGLTAISKVPT